MTKDNDTEPEKLDLRSMSPAVERRAEVLRLFPEARTEAGEINFEQLKRALGETVDGGRERYGFVWSGKAECFKTIQAPSLATLLPVPDESVSFDTTENVMIEGDNLEVLKLLQKSYLGRVKMIYIDPPYNTGSDFIYPDSYAESLQTYLEYTGQVDAEGRKFGTNADSDGRFHSKWLNMMYPRLYLAKNLLRDDGLIFISIDNNEITHLRPICDEIFGSENFVEQIAWKNKYGAGAKTKGFIEVHEYILCYSRNPIDNIESKLSDEQKEEYKLKDAKFAKRGGYLTQPLMTTSLGDRENLQYTIEYDGDVIKPRKQWVWEKTRLLQAKKDGELVIKKKADGDYSVRAKVYLYDENGKIRKGKPLSLLNGPFNQSGTAEVEELLGAGIFDFPKPVELIKYLFGFSINGKDDNDGVFLDFFSGSNTSAQAVMELNREDGGHRTFIMVQLPERCDEGSRARLAGYKTIAEIGRKRILKYGEKSAKAKKEELDFDDRRSVDCGFRFFRLSESNFKTWNGETAKDAETLSQQLALHIDHLRQGRTSSDFLYEILLKSGFALTANVEQITITGKSVFGIAGGALLICLERQLTLELLRGMADRKPERVVCLDEGFAGNDQLKANAVQTFKTKNIVFRTV
jgi:adenine-specific DNA-methyltransferase